MPKMLLWATMVFIIAVLLDFIQYAYGSAVYYVAARYRECKKQTAAKPLGNRVWIFGEFCFLGKCVAVITGYMFVLEHVSSM